MNDAHTIDSADDLAPIRAAVRALCEKFPGEYWHALDRDHYRGNGQKLWTSRAEHSDLMLLLARTTPRGEVKRRTEGLSVFLVDMRAVKGKGLTIRPIRTMMNHATTEVFFDNMRIP